MKRKSRSNRGRHRGASSPRTRVLIVDDHAFMRDLMARSLDRDFSVVAAVGTAGEAVTACAKWSPDVVILDLQLPDRSGLEVLPELKRTSPGTRVLLCTAYPQEQPMSELVKAGAQGYVEKTSTWEEFLDAVERVSRGEAYFCSHGACGSTRPTAGLVIRPGNLRTAAEESLTGREHEVVDLLAQGLTSKEIAVKLHISPTTVDTHRTNAMGKLKVHNVASLISRAFGTGIIKTARS